jgi:hypothetical protein
VRYADGPTTEVHVRIDAPPAAIWPLVTDIDLPARFSSEFQGAEWLDERRFRGRNHHDAVGDWESTSFVVERDEPRAFTWAVSDPDVPAASWGFRLEPDGDGTVLTQWVRIGPGPSGLTPAIEAMPDKEERIIERRLAEHRANMTATLEGIKAIAELG